MNRVRVPSLNGPFMSVAANRVQLAQLSKATLADLSHVLENLLIEQELPAAVFTGFQTGRNWVAELERYERLVAPAARSVAVFAAGNLGDTGEVIGFEVAADNPLTQEWFVVVLTADFCCALFGADNPSQEVPAEEMDRVFDAAWTFDPSLVSDLCAVLRRETLAIDATRVTVVDDALHRFPPTQRSAHFEAMFTARVFEILEAGRRRWRRQLVHSNAMQDRLQQAHAEALRMERLAAVGTTAASLAHELNNPLAAIGITAELMRSQATAGPVDAATLAAWADRIGTLAARSGRMTRGILELVRGHEVRLEPVVLEPVLAEIAEELAHRSHRRVTVVCPASVAVQADRDRLRHIITNLVDNAVHASADDANVLISVGEGDGDLIDIDVIDRGSGVPADMIDTIFEPFQTSRSGTGGTGLGLSLAKRFTDEQAGRLALRSTGPNGSTFTLSLPHVATPRPAAAPPTIPLDDGAERSDGRCILVIDDDADVRSLLAHLLRQGGWEVWTAGSADEAREQVSARHHDAVLLDFRLGDGSEPVGLLRSLDELRPGSSQRCVMISGSLSREMPLAQLPPVLLKPFSRDELEAAIASRLAGAN